eukprot:768763-Hanusia_phi.AAC.2
MENQGPFATMRRMIRYVNECSMRSAILANEMRRFDGIGLYVGMAMKLRAFLHWRVGLQCACKLNAIGIA